MPLDQNPHQTVIRFGCVGFSMYACGFSVARIFACLHIRQDQNELHEKMIFFAKIGIFCKSICHNTFQRYSSINTTKFVRRKDTTKYHTWCCWRCLTCSLNRGYCLLNYGEYDECPIRHRYADMVPSFFE